MNRIFYIQSNILTICCYQTVKECLEQNEKVIIITNRGYSWPFFKEKVLVYDFAKIFEGEDKDRVALHSFSALYDYIRYRKFLTHLNKVVDEIVAKEDFIFYMPSMAMAMTKTFAYHKHCKGYYYVDEGYLAYTPSETLKLYLPNRKKNLIKALLKIEDHYHLEMTSRFKGTVSITNDAFEWNSKEKIVNSVEEYVEEVKNDIPYYDDVILTEYLTQDFEDLKRGIDYTVEKILQEKPTSKIGIKIHPHAITYNRDQTIIFQSYLRDHYSGVITEIPTNVSIEVMSLVYHPNLFSLLELSSIILYAILFKSSKTKLIDFKERAVSIKEIISVEDYNNNVTLEVKR